MTSMLFTSSAVARTRAPASSRVEGQQGHVTHSTHGKSVLTLSDDFIVTILGSALAAGNSGGNVTRSKAESRPIGDKYRRKSSCPT
jgi:hypothetical protein